MKVFEEMEYNRCVTTAEKFTESAERKYEADDYKEAARNYYHAAVLYEQAKELAGDVLFLDKMLDAKEKEYYCLEKIDELKRFRNTRVEDVIQK